ncbi:MAG TPA: serine hydrolase [Actinopolymorphaceae bacterium]|nr:serine hydrolase [Actinopolymorphaceae bacterium]
MAPLVEPEWPTERPSYDSLEACVQAEASRWNVPGIAVGVLQDGHVESLAFGVTSIDTRQPVSPDTIFQIGSISKVFTATLVMQLVDEGVLDLDVPVVTYLPDLELADAGARASITLRQLLAHFSGLEGDRFLDYGRGDDGLAAAVATYGTLRQWVPPGRLWTYSNAGFSLAGRVVEAVTGEIFEAVIKARLFDPLGLERTVFFAEDAITWPHAVGHLLPSRTSGHTVARPYSFPRSINPAGGIVSSTAELLRFASLHIGDGVVDGQRLLPVAAVRAMREPLTEAGNFGRSYGIGWSVWDVDGVRIVDHGGATRGFRAQLTVVPDRGFALAQLTNGEPGAQAMAEIEAWALGHYRGIAKQTDRPVVDLAPAALEAFAGVYERHDGRYDVTVDGGRFLVEVTEIDEETGTEEQRPSLLLEPVGVRRFRSVRGPTKDGIVDFLSVDTDGRPAGLDGGAAGSSGAAGPSTDGEAPTSDEGKPRALMRLGGRLSERTPPSPPRDHDRDHEGKRGP